MKFLPSYRILVSNYPSKEDTPTKQLLDDVGGEFRSQFGDAINSCAIRVSYALNHSGARIAPIAGVYMVKGAAPKGRTAGSPAPQPDWYIVGVPAMKKYLTHTYGSGRLIYDARTAGDKLLGINRATRGIILFQWDGPIAAFGATGHVDLFQLWASNPQAPTDLLAQCEGACYWQPTAKPMEALLWESPP